MIKTLVKYLLSVRLMRVVRKAMFGCQPRVLMYHRILDNPLIPAISPADFEKHLIYLKHNYRIVPINQFITDLKLGTLAGDVVSLTFDDGHYDFYTNAWPLLKKHNVPATLYVTTNFVSGVQWLWADALKYVLWKAEKGVIELPNFPKRKLTRDTVLDVWSDLGDHLLTLGSKERFGLITKLAEDLGVEFSSIPEHPFVSVTWDQLKEMQKEGLDVGSHTVTHPVLSLMSKEEIGIELKDSIEEIAKHIKPPTGLCYPNGREQDINGDVVEEAKHLKYEYGVLAVDVNIDAQQLFKIGRLAATPKVSDLNWRLLSKPRSQEDLALQRY